MHPQILQNIRQRLYYHGTDRASAAAIIAQGFRVLDKSCYRHLGKGLYVTSNPGTAMYFGQVVLQVELRSGLRLLDTDAPFDAAVIGWLKREFGREILEKAPRLVLPANKRLTLEEAVALFLYHSHKGHFWASLRGNPFADTAPVAYRLHREMRSLLSRYGFHGYGEADTFGGIVLFSPDSARAIDVVIDLPDAEYEADAYFDFNNGCSSEDGASPHRTVDDVHARLKELFPRQSARDWQGNVLAPQTTTELER